ncbi:AGO12, partial [Symbiodinium microadriaticum]
MPSETSFKKAYQVKITRSAVIDTRDLNQGTEAAIRALTAAVHEFARSGQYNEPQKWSLVGSKVFRHLEDPVCERGTPYFLQRGYYAGLKACLAGLVFVSDMAVTCFLLGGPAINVVWQAAGCHDFHDFERELRHNPLRREQIEAVNRVLNKVKIRTTHLKCFKKFKGLGPPANSPESCFPHNGVDITVADYFEQMAQSNPTYADALSRGRLRYPNFPTVNVGSRNRQVLVPLELIEIAAGQSLKLQAYTEKLTQETIKKAAVRPAERMQFICDRDDDGGRSFVKHLASDMTAARFGISDVSVEPLEVDAYVLPGARLKYKDSVQDIGTQGRWFTPRDGYFWSASEKNGNSDIMYGIIATIDGHPRNIDRSLQVQRELETAARNLNLKLRMGGQIMPAQPHSIEPILQTMKDKGAQIVVVLLNLRSDYGAVKLAGDSVGVLTQCMDWGKVKEKTPKGYFDNVSLKMNAKLGGISHTLEQRYRGGADN